MAVNCLAGAWPAGRFRVLTRRAEHANLYKYGTRTAGRASWTPDIGRSCENRKADKDVYRTGHSSRRGPMKKTVSLKKIEANRRNALRSTGPRSPMGRRNVRWNALKHGLRSSELVMAWGEAREGRKEFAALLDGLRQDLQPAGELEELLVQEIAVGYCRLRRLLRCEAKEIGKGFAAARRQDQAPLSEGFLASPSLPSGPAASTILRYSAPIERGFHRAVKLLFQLQGLRKDEEGGAAQDADGEERDPGVVKESRRPHAEEANKKRKQEACLWGPIKNCQTKPRNSLKINSLGLCGR